ncbi:sensor domain-containing protein [Streptomyces sp. NPDC002640]
MFTSPAHTRRAYRAAVGLFLALPLLAACAGAEDGPADGASTSLGIGASAMPLPGSKGALPLSVVQLEQAALTGPDLPSGVISSKAGPGDFPKPETVRAEDKCRPVALLQAGSVIGAPITVVRRTWTGRADNDASTRLTARITLASYASEEAAQKVTAALDRAANDCAEGFTYEAPGTQARNREITRVLAPQGADEAMTLTARIGKSKRPVSLTLARKGATAVHITVTSTGDTAELPDGLVETQFLKLNQ